MVAAAAARRPSSLAATATVLGGGEADQCPRPTGSLQNAATGCLAVDSSSPPFSGACSATTSEPNKNFLFPIRGHRVNFRPVVPFVFLTRDGRLGLPRSDDDHHRGRRDGRVVVVVVVVRHRDRDRRQQDAVVERVDVPPMVESVLDVRRSGKILPTAVRSNEKAVIFGFGLWHQRRRRQWRQGHGHGTPANVHRVFRASTAPAHR